jgi:hypothetical protein
MDSGPERFESNDWLRPQSEVPGLFMTGVDITTLGVTGALMSGALFVAFEMRAAAVVCALRLRCYSMLVLSVLRLY